MRTSNENRAAPVAIAAFEGWNDAGDAATAAVEHLEAILDARWMGDIDPDEYYDFQVNRPWNDNTDPADRRWEWPTTRFSLATVPELGHDILLVRGIEPNMRWRAFITEIVDFLKLNSAEMVVSVAALLADAPHTKPLPVTTNGTDRKTTERYGLPRETKYTGPSGVSTLLTYAAHAADLKAVGFWAHVPHYMSTPPCPKATLSLLHEIGDLLKWDVPLGDLPRRAADWERQVDDLAKSDSEMTEYIRTLEGRPYDPSGGWQEGQ